jgi:hypothetical protein
MFGGVLSGGLLGLGGLITVSDDPESPPYANFC